MLADEFFCSQLPKVELHAHLNGSLSDETLLKLLKLKNTEKLKSSSAVIRKGNQRSMSECFDVFNVLHELIDDCEAIKTVTESVLDDFEKDNVKYLELRSTPRSNPNTHLTKRNYIETILNVIKNWNYQHGNKMLVRFLPSIDRGKSVNDAWETMKLTQEYFLLSDGLIPGIDFSGNPYVGKAKEFLPILLAAKNSGLKLAVHMAEIKDNGDENQTFLSLPPDRIGHGTYLNESKELCDVIKKERIPLEVCVTSNIKTKTSPVDISQHHLGWWTNQFVSSLSQHPCILCTDDKGVFSTSLSSEYHDVSRAFGLSKKETFEFSQNSVQYIFADFQTKQKLLKLFDYNKII